MTQSAPAPQECEWDEPCSSPATHVVMTCHGHYHTCSLHAQRSIGEPGVQYIVKYGVNFPQK